MKIMILNGKGECGKDTFIELLRKYTSVYHWSSIDTIKDIAINYFDWDGKKDLAGRKMLSDLKLAAVAYNDMPHTEFKNKVQIAEGIGAKLMVAVIRDIPEIIKALEDPDLNEYEIKTVLIQRNGLPNKLGNSADDNVDFFIYDYYIDNNSTIEELEESAMTLLNAMGVERSK